MTTTNKTANITTRDSVVCAQIDTEMILLNLETGIYFGLNEVGARIWSLLSAGANEAHLLETLSAEYDASAGELQTDISEFLALLHANDLVLASDE